MPFLLSRSKPNSGHLYRVRGGKCLLGRQDGCDIQDLFLDNARVSRKHAQVVRVDGAYHLEDLNSRRGTLLNGEPVVRSAALHNGDLINICDHELVFYLDVPTMELPTTDDPDCDATYVDSVDENILSTVHMDQVAISINAETKLAALRRLLSGLSRCDNVDEMLEDLLDAMFEIFPGAERGFVGLRQDADDLVPRAIRRRSDDLSEAICISRTVVERVMSTKLAILSQDVRIDRHLNASQSLEEFGIASVMCAPLTNAQGEVVGIVQLDTSEADDPFTSDELELLASVAAPIAVALNYAQLHADAVRRVALDRDLALARRVQLGLLPDTTPVVSGYEFFDYYEPAYSVGGDFYDYVPLSDGRWAVIIADVSGKGVSASLLVAKLSGELRSYLAAEATPSLAVERMNRSLCRYSGAHFVTFLMAIVTPDNETVSLINAGHMAAILRKPDGSIMEVGEETRGTPLGILDDQDYPAEETQLADGDCLLLYTDGFSEAEKTDHEMYGVARLLERVAQPSSTAAELGKGVLEDVKQFCGDSPQADDMCLICLRHGAD